MDDSRLHKQLFAQAILALSSTCIFFSDPFLEAHCFSLTLPPPVPYTSCRGQEGKGPVLQNKCMPHAGVGLMRLELRKSGKHQEG